MFQFVVNCIISIYWFHADYGVVAVLLMNCGRCVAALWWGNFDINSHTHLHTYVRRWVSAERRGSNRDLGWVWRARLYRVWTKSGARELRTVVVMRRFWVQYGETTEGKWDHEFGDSKHWSIQLVSTLLPDSPYNLLPYWWLPYWWLALNSRLPLLSQGPADFFLEMWLSPGNQN